MPRTSLSGYYSKAFASLQEGTLAVDTASAVFNCTSPFDFDIQLGSVSKLKFDSSADEIVVASPIKSTTGAVETLRLSTNATDYTKFTLDANGGLAIQSVDAAAAAANIAIIADGTFAVTSTGFNLTGAGALSGITTIDGSGDLTMGTITMPGFSVDADGDTVIKSLQGPAGGLTITGGTGSGDNLLLVSTSHGTKGDIQFHSSNYSITVGGEATLGRSIQLTGVTDGWIYGSIADGGGLLLLSTTHINKGNIQFHSSGYYITVAGALTVGAITGTTLNTHTIPAGTSTLEIISNKGVASGYAPLDANVRIPVAQTPALSRSAFIGVVPYAEMSSVQGTWGFQADAGQTDWNDLFVSAAGIIYNTTGNNLDEIKFPNLTLDAGTYAIRVATTKDLDRGILEVLHGNTSIATSDQYNATVVYNSVPPLTSYTIAARTTGDLRFRVNGKNASSEGYYLTISRIQIRKTA